jgi:hypothetical protein
MNKGIYLNLIVVFILVCVISLVKTSNVSGLYIALVILLYVSFLILLNGILEYSNPPAWLYRLRFIICSLESGFGFSLGLSVFKLMEQTPFDVARLVFYAIGFSAISFFGAIIPDVSYFRFRKLIRMTGRSTGKDLTNADSAYYADSELFRTSGCLILENDRLYFYSAEENKCLFNEKLSDIHPVIEKSSVLKTPKGLDFQMNETKIYMKFPYYWLNAIKNTKATAVE